MVDAWDIILWGSGNVITIVIAFVIAHHFKYKVKTKQEITWDKNRESVVWYSLSTIDNEITFMDLVFSFLAQNNVDVSQEELFIGTGHTMAVSPQSIQEQINRLPGFSNALGFMTHEQYTAVTNYLGYSLVFIRSLENGSYQKMYLQLRADNARKILELFPREIEQHRGLQRWKEQFDST